MSSTSETGHAKNVANFDTLNSYCTGYGASYNPSNPLLTLNAITTLHTTASGSLKTVKEADTAWTNAVGSRRALFIPFNKLVTRVFNALKTSGAPQSVIADAEGVVRKLRGERASAPPPPTGEDGPNTISVSQLSFDNRIDNFDSLLTILTAEPKYTPNEPELTIASLTSLLADMRAVNKLVKDNDAALGNARKERNRILYAEETGLVAVAIAVKDYVKSVFGSGSTEHKKVAKLKFVVIDDD